MLDAHIAASPRFRGIRHAAGWDASDQVRNSHTNPPPGLYGDDRFRRGFAELARRGSDASTPGSTTRRSPS